MEFEAWILQHGVWSLAHGDVNDKIEGEVWNTGRHFNHQPETNFMQSGYHNQHYELSRIAVNAEATASFAFVMSSGVLWSPGPLSCS